VRGRGRGRGREKGEGRREKGKITFSDKRCEVLPFPLLPSLFPLPPSPFPLLFINTTH
jgi:hypothetical protein